MSNSVFLSANITETTNPNPQNSYIWDSSTYYQDHHQPLDFDPSDYLALLDHHPEEDAISRFTAASLSQSQIFQETSTAGISLTNSHMQVFCYCSPSSLFLILLLFFNVVFDDIYYCVGNVEVGGREIRMRDVRKLQLEQSLLLRLWMMASNGESMGKK